MPKPPPEVKAAFDAMPAGTRGSALALRDLIFRTAKENDLPVPEETLKWGQPAYLPGPQGTTLRIGCEKTTDTCKLLVHCQTTLVSSWRERFGDQLRFESNRAMLTWNTRH